MLLEDVNVRETLKSASGQAGTDPRWTSAVRAALSTSAKRRTHGDRLAVVAHMLTEAQIASDDKLRTLLVEIISLLVITDDVERKRCLSAMGEQPALLDPELKGTGKLVNWIATDGSPGAVTWLFELLSRNPSLRHRYRGVLRRALSRTLDEGRFGKQVQALVSRALPKSSLVHTGLTAVRLALLGVGYYLTYLVAWTAATLVLIPLRERLAPAEFSFAELWRLQFELTDLQFQGWRLFYVVGTILVARKLLRARADEGLGPRKWVTRYLVLLLIVFGVRVGWDLIRLAPELVERLPLVWVLVGLAVVVVPLVVVAGWRHFRRGPKPAPGADREPAEEVPGARVFWLIIAKLKDPFLRIKPTESMPDVPATRQQAGQHTTLARTAIAVGLGLGLAFFLGRVDLVIVVVAAGLVAVIVTTMFVGPLREVRETKKRIEEQVRDGLATDHNATVSVVLGQIEDDRLLPWVRIALVNALSVARFDDALRHQLETVYARLPEGPVKARLTDVVERVHHEYRKRGHS